MIEMTRVEGALGGAGTPPKPFEDRRPVCRAEDGAQGQAGGRGIAGDEGDRLAIPDVIAQQGRGVLGVTGKTSKT